MIKARFCTNEAAKSIASLYERFNKRGDCAPPLVLIENEVAASLWKDEIQSLVNAMQNESGIEDTELHYLDFSSGEAEVWSEDQKSKSIFKDEFGGGSASGFGWNWRVIIVISSMTSDAWKSGTAPATMKKWGEDIKLVFTLPLIPRELERQTAIDSPLGACTVDIETWANNGNFKCDENLLRQIFPLGHSSFVSPMLRLGERVSFDFTNYPSWAWETTGEIDDHGQDALASFSSLINGPILALATANRSFTVSELQSVALHGHAEDLLNYCPREDIVRLINNSLIEIDSIPGLPGEIIDWSSVTFKFQDGVAEILASVVPDTDTQQFLQLVERVLEND